MRTIIAALLLALSFGCVEEKIELTKNTENTANAFCGFEDLGITEAAKKTIDPNYIGLATSGNNQIVWKASYTNTEVIIELSSLCGDECGGKEVYVFTKNYDCINFSHAYYQAYDINDGPELKLIKVTDVLIQEWITDARLVGRLNYEDATFTKRDFWIDLTPENYNDEEVIYENSTCFEEKFPNAADIDNDNIDDVSFIYTASSLSNGLGTKFNFTYKVLNENIEILKQPSDTQVVYSQNINTEDLEVDNNGSLIVEFFEYTKLYAQYNIWHSSLLSGMRSCNLNDTEDDYLFFRKKINTTDYQYGWVKVLFDKENCGLSFGGYYLNPLPNQHIQID